MSRRLRFGPWTALVLLTGCSLLPTPAVRPAVYDLGAARPAIAGPALQAADITAAPWLDGTGISYRLLYRDAYRRELYRDSRWAAPPAALLAQRLRERLGPVGAAADTATAPRLLRIELDEFSQVFDSATHSRVLLRLRARLENGKAPAEERSVTLERDAPTQDAAGAVQALSAASDDAVDQLLAWARQR